MKSIQLSENRFNQLVAEVSRKLMEAYPFPGGSIRGEDIVNFSGHKQVNNFVLFLIYQDWNNQFGRFINPNFDFEHQEVREALKKFLNVLSRHIKVRKEDFAKMVEKSVYNSLKLALNPEDAFRGFFFQGSERIPVETFHRYAGYFSDYDFAIQGILKYLQKNQLKVLEREVFLEKFRRVCQIFDEMEGKSIVAYQKFLFNKLTGLDMDQVVATDKVVAETPVPPPPPVAKTPPPSTLGNTFIKRETIVPPPVKQEVNTVPPVQPPPPIEKKTEPVIPPVVHTPPPVFEKKIETPVPPVNPPATFISTPPPVEKKETSTLNESLGKSPTLSDSFVKEQQEKMKAMLEKIQNKPAEETPPPPPVVEAPKVEIKPEPLVKQDMPVFEKFVKAEEEKIVEPVLPPAPEVVFTPVSLPEPEPEPEVTPMDLFSTKTVEEPAPLHEVIQDDSQKLAEKFKSSNGSSSLHEKLTTTNIKLEQIPVNKQFQFVQKIFGGSSVKFKVVLDKINQTQSPDEAKDVLEKYVFNAPEVNQSDKISQEFVSLVMNRFS